MKKLTNVRIYNAVFSSGDIELLEINLNSSQPIISRYSSWNVLEWKKQLIPRENLQATTAKSQNFEWDLRFTLKYPPQF